jgi:hypothetical protein
MYLLKKPRYGFLVLLLLLLLHLLLLLLLLQFLLLLNGEAFGRELSRTVQDEDYD